MDSEPVKKVFEVGNFEVCFIVVVFTDEFVVYGAFINNVAIDKMKG